LRSRDCRHTPHWLEVCAKFNERGLILAAKCDPIGKHRQHRDALHAESARPALCIVQAFTARQTGQRVQHHTLCIKAIECGCSAKPTWLARLNLESTAKQRSVRQATHDFDTDWQRHRPHVRAVRREV
jgi:hypothetical protein